VGIAALACADDLARAQETIAERVQVRGILTGSRVPAVADEFRVRRSASDLIFVGTLGVIVRRLGRFGARSTYRITIGTPAENDALIASLRAIFHHLPPRRRRRLELKRTHDPPRADDHPLPIDRRAVGFR
jgi:histidinol-phosphate/aromatic aminotransferase/cobyric acid decarboxylase-like protein